MNYKYAPDSCSLIFNFLLLLSHSLSDYDDFLHADGQASMPTFLGLEHLWVLWSGQVRNDPKFDCSSYTMINTWSFLIAMCNYWEILNASYDLKRPSMERMYGYSEFCWQLILLLNSTSGFCAALDLLLCGPLQVSRMLCVTRWTVSSETRGKSSRCRGAFCSIYGCNVHRSYLPHILNSNQQSCSTHFIHHRYFIELQTTLLHYKYRVLKVPASGVDIYL